jgi:high affinity Mn2+ porin
MYAALKLLGSCCMAEIAATVNGRCAPRLSARAIAASQPLAAAFAALVIGTGGALADDVMVTTPMVTKAPALTPSASSSAYDWSGFYVGGHFGVAFGNSNWTATSPGAPAVTGTTNLFQSIDSFSETGSFFAGAQTGYNRMLANRVLVGAEADATLPSFLSIAGTSIGGVSTFTSPTLGRETFAETELASGTVRGRIGYAPGHWLFYATGGFAWTRDRQTLTQVTTGLVDNPFLWRFGWTAGAGLEVPVAPQWSARLEYLFKDYDIDSRSFFAGAQAINSSFTVQEVRVGLDYQLAGGADNNAASPPLAVKAPATAAPDNINFHGQATFTWQGYPAFRSSFSGINSLPGGGIGRETFDGTLAIGVRLWQGAEFWTDPEIDQGFGLANTHGVAGFPSAEAYKIGADYPYARVQRYFIRQTIDLGGDSEKVAADFHQFAGTQTDNRLVLTVGKFAVVDIFDTNKYANNPKGDFLNWSLVNAGSFDYAGDGWGYTYGAAAEWYQGRFALRGGIFDLSQTPAGGISPLGDNLDPSFRQFQLIGEIEERHALWGEPGKLKITAFLSRGDAGNFQDAINLDAITGGPADINAVRQYTSRPGVSLNLEQQVSDNVGVFARTGFADGNIEPWDFTDIDRTVSGGVSIGGKPWSRPDDTVGIAGVINGISGVHQAFLNDGGLGILVGDGQLPNPGVEQILETYYSYAITASTKVTADYQFIVNPAYTAARGPVNVFAARLHTQF